MESGNGLKERDRSSLRGSKAPVLAAHGLWGLLRVESTENYLVGMRLVVVWRGKSGKGPSWEEEKDEEEEWEEWEKEKGKGRKRGESGGGTEKAHGSVRRGDLSGVSVEDGLRAKESGLQAVDSPAAHPFPAVRTVTWPQEA